MADYYISLKELFEILLKIMIDRIAGIKIDINRHRLLLFSIYLDILFTRDDAVNIDTQWTIWIYTSIFQIIITTRLALLLSRFVMNHFDAVWDKVGCKILLKILLASFLTVKSVIQIQFQLLSKFIRWKKIIQEYFLLNFITLWWNQFRFQFKIAYIRRARITKIFYF